MATFEATAVSTTDTGLTVSARGFDWVVDEPLSLGGGDLDPNPVEYVLGALLGCFNVVVHLVAKEHGVTLTSFTAKASGNLDPAKFWERTWRAERVTRASTSSSRSRVTRTLPRSRRSCGSPSHVAPCRTTWPTSRRCPSTSSRRARAAPVKDSHAPRGRSRTRGGRAVAF